MNEKALVPDPRSRPWPRPIEYVYVSWGCTVVFGSMMLPFWALADDPTSVRTVLVMGGFLGGLAAFVTGTTARTAHKTGASWREVTQAVRTAAPARLRFDYVR